MLHARETRSKTRTVFHFNFPRGRNLVFEKLFHNASRLLPHRMCRQSIAFVSSPLRTRVPKLSERRCIPRSRISLLFVAFIHPSIHPPLPSFLSFLPNSSRGSFAKFHPRPESRDFSILARNPSTTVRKLEGDQFSKIRESFPGRLLPPGRRDAR